MDIQKAAEFCETVNGKPWVNRAEGPDAYDCWGLVLASFRDIDGIELPQVEGYTDKKCKTSDAADQLFATGKFMPSQPCDGAIMCIFDTKGRLEHVGRCLCGRVAHATSALGVRLESYSVIMSRYNNVKYFRYAG